MSRTSMTRRLRPLAFSLALGLGGAMALASAAYARGQTYSYATDVWPAVHAQMDRTTTPSAVKVAPQSPVASEGSSIAPRHAVARLAATNPDGQRVNRAGIPIIQDRSIDG